MINRSLIATSAAMTSLAASASFAEPIPLAGQSEDEWRQTLAIYAFLPARTSGTSTVAGATIPLDLDFGDALELLDFAAAGRYEIWRGDWGFIIDANYVSLEADGNLPTPGSAAFTADIRQKWIGLLAAYKAVDAVSDNGQRYAVDLQFGARYNSLRQEITVSSPLPVPVLGGDQGWWEPVIGARGTWVLNDQWTAIASLDLGGFGAGGNDLQIGANIGVDWRAWDSASLFFGWRYYSMDYSDSLFTGAFEYDVDQHGPVLGVKFRF
ncbi:outer membrane protein [Ruegeria sp. Alg231-54]|uniref:outer membrane protein n=1 Tax=Ruegeria sp. Alg231-54 TaxID=1922221 RepID=UPI000D55569D|nr:hypothetical protein [Ruegeria sp. Alg231-54]